MNTTQEIIALMPLGNVHASTAGPLPYQLAQMHKCACHEVLCIFEPVTIWTAFVRDLLYLQQADGISDT